MAMDPSGDVRIGRKETFGIQRLTAADEPFRLAIADSVLTDTGMRGGFADVAWDLSWQPRLAAYGHVHPLLERLKLAKTVLALPHADLAVSGTVSFAGRELRLDGVRGAQAHLWGSKHATRWAWAHCNDFTSLEGEPRPDTFVDGVSVVVARFGREIGPNTPVVGRFAGEDFIATSPPAVVRNRSRFALTSWRFEARVGSRRIVGEVDAPRASLVGVTYHDPDGDEAYCYNSEVASMRLFVWDKLARGRFGWRLSDTLVAPGRAHFEYAQREPVAALELHVR
jgi:hypothetical protein